MELDEDYNINVYDKGQKYPLDRFSGGEADLAVVKMDDPPANLPVVKVADKGPVPGEPVSALGNGAIGLLWAIKARAAATACDPPEPIPSTPSVGWITSPVPVTSSV